MRVIAMTRCPPWLTDLPGERSGRRFMAREKFCAALTNQQLDG